MRRLFVTAWLFCFCFVAEAHIGSPNVFFEGNAGPYPLRVVIKPPQVVPGLAEISIRVQAGSAHDVSVLPIFWRAGRKGAPPPDFAVPVFGETNLYSAALWLMKAGAYNVEVVVRGSAGEGKLLVPVNSIATNTRPMSAGFSMMLSALGILLFIGGLAIAGAAFGQSLIPEGASLQAKDRWRGRLAMIVTGLILFGLVFGGKKWWDFEDKNYRNNSLYHPMPITASVRTEHNEHILRVKIDASDHRGDWTPLLPDHGKLMHLFLVGDGVPSAFAHLHPISKNGTGTLFEAALPPLPAASYRLYADITHESGFAETLTNEVDLPAPSGEMTRIWLGNLSEPICSSTVAERLSTNLFFPPDRDDSWYLHSQKDSATQVLVGGDYLLRWENPSTLKRDQDVSLRFRLLTGQTKSAAIEPYLGMLGHAVVRHKDGTVFTHVHPSGTFSMAAQEYFTKGKTGEPNPVSAAANEHNNHTNGVVADISFPYAFPKSGPYTIWVQTKSDGKILTGRFDVNVAGASR